MNHEEQSDHAQADETVPPNTAPPARRAEITGALPLLARLTPFGRVAQALVIAVTALFVALAFDASPASAGWWYSTGGGIKTPCPAGFTCARTHQYLIYGNVTKGACRYSYNNNGHLVGANCDGYTPNQTCCANRNGYAVLDCDAPQVRTATGCITAPPPDQNPSCPAVTANPVDTSSGMKIQSVVDFSTPGQNELQFRRRYSSVAQYWQGGAGVLGTRLGRNWRSNFDSLAFFVGSASGTPTSVTIILPDAVETTFRPVSGSTTNFERLQYSSSGYSSPSNFGSWYQLEKDLSNSQYVLTDASDTKYSYDYNGRLVRILRSNGYYQDLTYDGSGRNSTVIDSYGRTLSFTYSTNGLLQTMTAPGGQLFTYGFVGRYDTAVWDTIATSDIPNYEWALETVTYPDSNADPNDNPKTTYHYENGSLPFALTGITDARNVRFATWTYQSDGRVASSQHAGGAELYNFTYDDANRKVTVTGPLGKDAVYYFQDNGRGLNRLTRIEGKPSANCVSSDEYLAYGANGYVSQTTDAEGRIITQTTDSRGRPTQIKEAASTAVERMSRPAWHVTQNLMTELQEPGLKTTFVVDAGSGGAITSFSANGGPEQLTVPAGVSSITVRLWGGAGGNGNFNVGAWSGAGGYVKATFAVSPGDTLKVEVGGGGQGAVRNGNGGAGGWPDGGSGGRGDAGSGGGGGSTRFYINNVLMGVAGGGGGSGGYTSGGVAGAGGGAAGQSGSNTGGGTGGTQSAPGVDGNDVANANKTGRSLVAYPGAQRTGGWGSNTGNTTTNSFDDGGGGGGGYFGGGGGGGDGRSGGGGSGFVHSSATDVTNTAGNVQAPAGNPPVAGVATGVNSGSNGAAIAGGDGYALISLN